ncbi:hypothetical protein JXB27_03510 [Candidatus Woesearchaeota archaeon]|nr:hypothetical protein [Candidatus Woesearchaeota archaeon]
MPEMPQPPKQEVKKNIFGKEESSPNIIADVAAQVNNVSRSVKTVEDRFSTMHKKAQVTEQNMIANDKKLFGEIKIINSELMDLKSEIADMKEKLILLVKELKLSATKEEVGVLQKYLSYWEPMNFVTRAELEKATVKKK